MGYLNERFTQVSTSVATLVFCWTIYENYLPSILRYPIDSITSRCSHKLLSYFISPYIVITIDERSRDRFNRSGIYSAVQNYLSDKASTEARSMKADYIKDGKTLMLSLGDNEEVLDEYKGVKVSWCFNTQVSTHSSSFYSTSEETRYYKLIFHNRDRNLVLYTYVPYVIEEGEAIAVRKRTRKLFTNAGNDGSDWSDRGTMWSHIDFKHPVKFDKLAMEQSKKQIIIDDLMWFKSSKDYYEEIGKPWKRGYLLYGPPGTGKSTLVAAIANLMDYDIYDLELTSVRSNVQLRRLLTHTTGKSIILIEDIDCSLDLTGQRKNNKDENEEKDKDQQVKTIIMEKQGESEKKGSEVTLSGLLNIIDGIWSCFGEERIIVFTTNYIDKLDPALIRRGRMDVHIQLSYCGFEAFQILAKNYLRLDSHPLFESIAKLLGEREMTLADVAENLMPRSMNTSTEACLQNLITALENAKEKKMVKSDKENYVQGG